MHQTHLHRVLLNATMAEYDLNYIKTVSMTALEGLSSAIPTKGQPGDSWVSALRTDARQGWVALPSAAGCPQAKNNGSAEM